MAWQSAAAREDRRGGLPTLSLQALRASGLLAAEERLPPAFAGVRELARADGSIAAILGGHIAARRLAAWAGLGQPDPALHASASGSTIGLRDGSGWRLTGAATAEAGTGVADRVLLIFRDAADVTYAAAVSPDAPGLVLEQAPAPIGLRQVAGATIRLTDLPVAAGTWGVITNTALEQFALLQQAARIALLVGTAEGALAEGRSYTVNKSRPWVYSGYAKHIDDPFVQRKYGDLHIRARAAAALAEAAFARLDAALQAEAAPSADLRAALDTAELWAGELALAAGAGIFEVMGARSATRENGYDRFWRNGRTVTLQHPAESKAIAIGDWLLGQSTLPSAQERRL